MKPQESFRSRYANRREAGAVLAQSLTEFAGRKDVVVLALPRGGVPVGYEVATALQAPLDVFVVRKLGLPVHPELAMGALASGGVRVMNDEVVAWYRPSRAQIEEVVAQESAELARRELAYRGRRPLFALKGLTVILVDDGLATGSTMKAAVMSVAQHKPAHIVVAVPVGARETCESLRALAAVVCPLMPEPLQAVGLWYDDFSQTTDDEVRHLLRATQTATTTGSHAGH
jgi:predicted phosphoribosyltransferase